MARQSASAHAVSPISTRSKSKSFELMSAPSSSPSELAFDRAKYWGALEKCVSSSARFPHHSGLGELVAPDWRHEVEALVDAMPDQAKHNAITCAWNHVDPPPSELALLNTTYFLDPQIKFGNLRVWSNVDKTLWLHCAADGVWRFANALGSGTTFAFAESTGGLHPPIASWCNREGEPLGELIVTDAIVWASLCIEHACHDIRSLPADKPDDPSDEPVEPPLKVQKRSGNPLPLSAEASPPCPWGPSPPKAPPSGFVRRLAAADGDDIGDGAAVPKHQSHGQWARSCLDAVGIYKLPKQVFLSH
jgi:hypothetical protein